jgi:CHC2 zinc finger protein
MSITPDNAIIGICFIIVCLFRDIIIRYRREFPSLFLFGPKGTGKTAFGELLQSPFVYGGDHPNLRTSTMPSLAIVLSQAENAMMHLDEYKNDIDVEKIELLKGLWDCQGRSKLDMETHKREQSKVLSGVIVSGQEKPTVDIALYSRQCVLPFHKDTHSADEKTKFRVLKDYEHAGTSYVIIELLRIRKTFEANYASCYEQAVKDICSAISYSIDERILHNWSVILASFMASDAHMRLPFSYEQVFKTVIRCVEYQNEECLHSNELSVFWKTADYLKQDNQIFGLCDYRIHDYSTLKVDVKIDGRRQSVTRDFGASKKILMIPTNSRLFAMYALHLQRTREKVIPENTLKYYIENSPEYIGKMNSVRFASVENVKDWPRQYELKIPNCQPRLSEKPVQAYCLDFDAVESAYGTNLYSDYMGFDLIHTS